MIFDLTCNGQKNPVNIDRSVCFRWKTNFNVERFSVCIEKNGELISKETVFSSVCVYSYKGELEPLTEYKCVIECCGDGCEESAEIGFRTALTGGFPKECKWIGAGSRPIELQDFNGNPATYIWKGFNVERIEKTYLHVAGLGLFFAEINGKKVSQDVLNCPFTNYNQSVLYASYDVSKYLVKGKNVIKIVVGDGWFNQTATDEWNFYQADWRDCAKAIVFMEGGVQLCSDESWICSQSGKIQASSIRLGERVNFAKNEQTGAKLVEIMQAPKGKLKSMEEFSIQETEIIEYKSVKDFGNCLQFDFGTSITGYARLSAVFGEQAIKIRYGDRLSEDGKIDNASNAQYVFGGEYQTDFVQGKGEKEIYQPSFTYHAFRYIELEGAQSIPSKEELKAIFIRSAFPKTGEFTSSNARLNHLYSLSMRSLECNYTGFPTDCTHREKNGWTGDMQLSAGVFIKNYEMESNIYKWLEDICEAQLADGMLPCIVPTSGWGYTWGNGPAWDYALFTLPYELYVQKGDTHALRIVYETCERYLQYLAKNEINGLVELGLGDWNYPKQVEMDICPLRFSTGCYYYSMANIFALFSRILGKTENEKLYLAKAAAIRKKLREEFLIDGGNGLKGITALAAALYFNLAETDEKTVIFRRLIDLIEKERYRALVGILGAKYVHNVLCEYGRQDVFIKMMECDEYPSFGAWVQRGATTLWEDFEGTNSRNHHMFADIASVMQTYLLGVKQSESGLLVQPYLDGFTHLEGRVITRNGSVRAVYTKKADKWLVELEIPYGVKATFTYQDKTIDLVNGNNSFWL